MEEPAESPVFATTHWSVVLAAKASADAGPTEALATLCRSYWFPLYAHVRRRGHDSESARDLTQGFFENFLHNAHRDANTLKRGGGRELVSLDAQDAEHRLTLEPADERSPDREFDRRWALATLDRARGRLSHEFLLSGKAELFEQLHPALLGESAGLPYAQLAAQLNMTIVAVKVTLHRLRHRYGEILREQVAHTLANPADAESELRHLIAALRDQ